MFNYDSSNNCFHSDIMSDPLRKAIIVAYSLPIHASVPSHAIIRVCVVSGKMLAPCGRLARLIVETAAPVAISASISASPASTTLLHSTAVHTHSRGTPVVHLIAGDSLVCFPYHCPQGIKHVRWPTLGDRAEMLIGRLHKRQKYSAYACTQIAPGLYFSMHPLPPLH